MHQLGIISQKAGDFEQAESSYRRAIEINKKIGYALGVQNLLESLGDLAEARQNFTDAERLYTDAFKISLDLNDRRSECELSVKLGKLVKKTGDLQKAVEYYARYMELAQKMNIPLLADVVQEYDQLRAKRHNPFIVGRPVQDEVFYGRNRELEVLYRWIQRRQNVMLIGERRMGKTSLLLRLSQRLEWPFVCVFVDLQAFPGQAEGLLNGVIRKVVEALLRQNLLSPDRWDKYSLTYASDFVKALESMIDEAKEKLKEIRIVLMLDEAERLLEFGNQVGGVVRAALTMNRDIVGVIAGTSQLDKLPVDLDSSPLFNIFIRLTLRPLSREDTETLIREPSKQVSVNYEPDALNRIYELSGGIPFYIQAICNQLIESVNQESQDRISVEDVNKIVPEIFERFSTVFQDSLHQLDDKERAILSMITSSKSLQDVRKKDIQKLENRQLIVEENGSYRFVSELFKEWFKRNKETI